MQSPTFECGEALVVLEGTARITWDDLGQGMQVPVKLWPSADQRGQIDRRLGRRAPLLVVLSRSEPTVCLLPEEARWISDELVSLLEGDGYFFTLRVPVLEWLPPRLAERGRRFLGDCARRAAALPAPLLPALFVEGGVDGLDWAQDPTHGAIPGPAAETDDEFAGVRFACRASTGPLARHHVASLTARLFGSDRTHELAHLDGHHV